MTGQLKHHMLLQPVGIATACLVHNLRDRLLALVVRNALASIPPALTNRWLQLPILKDLAYKKPTKAKGQGFFFCFGEIGKRSNKRKKKRVAKFKMAAWGNEREGRGEPKWGFSFFFLLVKSDCRESLFGPLACYSWPS